MDRLKTFWPTLRRLLTLIRFFEILLQYCMIYIAIPFSLTSFKGKHKKFLITIIFVYTFMSVYIHIGTRSILMKNNLFVAKFSLSSQKVLSLNSSLSNHFQTLTRFSFFFVCLFLSLLMNDDGGWFVVSFVWYKCLL